MSDNRDMGIDFGDLDEDLSNEDYPMTREELLEKYGDRELEHAGGTTTVAEVVEPLGREEFDGHDAIHQTILNMVGRGAEGRPRYSDRGGSTPNEEKEGEGVGEGMSEDSNQESL